MVNSVVIVGNIARDITDQHYFEKARDDGSMFRTLNIVVAVNHRKRDGSSEVSYFDVKCFNGWAKSVKDLKKKGDQVAISGFLKQEKWEDKNTGETRYAVRIMANVVQFLGAPPVKGDNDAVVEQEIDTPTTMPKSEPEAQVQVVAGDANGDDDIPF